MNSTGRREMMTSSDVARALHLHVNTVRRWSNQGILKSFRIGPRGDRRFLRDDISDYLSSHETQQLPS